MTKQPEGTTEELSIRSAESELNWQDECAQRYRAAQLFHSDEWDDVPEENWDD